MALVERWRRIPLRAWRFVRRPWQEKEDGSGRERAAEHRAQSNQYASKKEDEADAAQAAAGRKRAATLRGSAFPQNSRAVPNPRTVRAADISVGGSTNSCGREYTD